MRAAADDNTNIIFGATVDERLAGQLWVTVVATGFPLPGQGSPRAGWRRSRRPSRSRERERLPAPPVRPRTSSRPTSSPTQQTRVAMRGAVAAGHELTARAGADALERGGSAVDALVAAAAMSWAAEPALTGPCGGGFALVRPARGRPALLDAFTSIPGHGLCPPSRRLVEPIAAEIPFDERTIQIFHIGAGSCAVPGRGAGAARRPRPLRPAAVARPAAAGRRGRRLAACP